jgi:transposase
VVRFETPPGVQGQVDFAHISLPWGRRWALVVVLGYSRLMWVKLFPRQRMAELISGLEEAFRFFGGVPQELLFDQMRAVVVSDLRDAGGSLKENTEFLRFANHWGFRIRSCRPYRARTKGKVERPIRYVRENFFYARAFAGDADVDAQLARWLDERANVRVHATTGEQPKVRFERDERALLRPVAATGYHRLGTPVEKRPKSASIARVAVERRALSVYDTLVGSSA